MVCSEEKKKGLENEKVVVVVVVVVVLYTVVCKAHVLEGRCWLFHASLFIYNFFFILLYLFFIPLSTLKVYAASFARLLILQTTFFFIFYPTFTPFKYYPRTIRSSQATLRFFPAKTKSGKKKISSFIDLIDIKLHQKNYVKRRYM